MSPVEIPQTVTPWLVLITSFVAALGAVGLACRVVWSMFLRSALASAMEDAFRHEFGANGDDHKLPEDERNKPLRSLVIASRVELVQTRLWMQEREQRDAEINAAIARIYADQERHAEHHGPLEAAIDEDRRVRGLRPVDEHASAQRRRL